MRIPKRFKLYAQTIEVEYQPDLLHRDDARGLAVYRESKIKLQPSNEANPIPQGQIEQTFCHELLHLIFNAAGYPEDRANEEKVERLAHLLHQALETCEYEDEKVFVVDPDGKHPTECWQVGKRIPC